MKKRTVPLFRVLLLLMIYFLQGVVIGFTTAIPFYLDSRGATWQEQGTFNFVFYPFSLKLAWAPILDAIYITRFGRRKTWLIPLQFSIGITLIILSFSLITLVEQLKIKFLTCIFFFVYFLLASQDTCVDGWALTLLAKYNLQWASTCQTVGQTTGRFIGFTVLMIFESADFTNRYVRQPLELPKQTYGLFTLDQFVRYCGVTFLILALCIASLNKGKKETNPMSLSQTYLSIWKLLNKSCIRQLAFIFLTSPVGFSPTYTMTNLVLKRYGVPKETLGLLGIPLIVVKIVIPLCMTHTDRPLTWYYRSYIPRLLMGIIIAIYVCLTPYLLHQWFFYPVLIGIFLCNESLIYLMIVTRVGFFARISDPSIGGTYITLLNTLGNLGASLMASSVLYLAGWIEPDEAAYPLLVSFAFVLGCFWFTAQYKTMKQLENLPSDEWCLSPTKRESDSYLL
ncbi:unnamed protein product [Adineta ricciae]|uniref:Acetyl-coenzyme A transporter 1 n=1 Tax=Adineta ricciae TaxID=249248 RepID=A0A813V7M3_ADIRI|nr:unnamed protein product [Adineta ricciae]